MFIRLSLILPELLVAGTALLVLLLDFTLRPKKRALLSLGLLGLALAAWFSATKISGTLIPLFSGNFSPDFFTALFRILFIGLGGAILFLLFEYREVESGEFIALLLFSILGMMLIAGSTDLIMIYVALETLSISSYILASLNKKDIKSQEAGLKYLLLGALASAIFLYGLSLLYGLTGTTNLAYIGYTLLFGHLSPVTMLATVLVITAIGFKIALVPFHVWAPDVYEGAPTAVTALFSVGPKAAGFALLFRMLFMGLLVTRPSWTIILAILAALSMTLGNLVAIPQTNIKRMLAYSSIAQAGYILMGLVASNSWFGLTGIFIYLIIYLLMNIGAFACVIAFANRTGSYEIADYRGLARNNPVLAASLTLFFLSLAGIPPLGGFVAKLFVFAGVLEAGFLWLAVIAVINCVISIYYYFNVVREMYLLPPLAETSLKNQWSTNFVILGTLTLTLIFGIYPMPLIALANLALGVFLRF